MTTRMLLLLSLLTGVGCGGQNVGFFDAGHDAASPISQTGFPPGGLWAGGDKVAPADNGVSPDGQADYAVAIVVTGPMLNLFLIGQDVPGVPDAIHPHARWDTVAGSSPIPEALGTEQTVGSETWAVGVYENDKLLNSPDGSLPALTAGNHSLTLFASQTGGTSHYYQVFAELPDHTLVRGEIIQYY